MLKTHRNIYKLQFVVKNSKTETTLENSRAWKFGKHIAKVDEEFVAILLLAILSWVEIVLERQEQKIFESVDIQWLTRLTIFGNNFSQWKRKGDFNCGYQLLETVAVQ